MLVPAETGLFTTTTDLVELIGRERILRFTLGNEQVKSIVSVEEAIEEGDTLSFDFSYKKVFIFNEAGDRVLLMKKYNPENQPKAWLFLLPSLGIILLFSVYPLFRSLWMSFQKGSLINQRYAGLENYQRVLNDPIFYKALKNTALYAFAVVPIALIISLQLLGLSLKKLNIRVSLKRFSLCLM